MASATVSPNATTDNLIHGWVSTNCGRGTIDIFWNSLFTIFLCVWTAIHPPVPCHEQERSNSIRTRIVKSKIGPSLMTLIAPEILCIVAINELVAARRTAMKINKIAGKSFTLTHAFFLTMGGFCIESPSKIRHQLRPKDVVKFKGEAIVPDWMMELQLVKKAQIKDMAKSDTLTKFIACGQTLWFVAHAGSRLIQNKAITLLEVSTMAYVLCAIIMYGFWWNKPQDCTSPIIIACTEDALGKVSPSAYNDEKWFEFLWAGRKEFSTVSSREFDDRAVIGYLFLIPAIFGAVHVSSWNITLPSQFELWMWRASALFCLIGPLVFILVSGLMDRLVFSDMIIIFLVIGYIIIRLFMIVEIFISLRALPASAYESVNWSTFIPHF